MTWADKTNKMMCAPSNDSDQPGICPAWSEFAVCSVAKHPRFLQADSKELIWVFAGRIGHFVGFIVLRLISHGAAQAGIFMFYLLSSRPI